MRDRDKRVGDGDARQKLGLERERRRKEDHENREERIQKRKRVEEEKSTQLTVCQGLAPCSLLPGRALCPRAWCPPPQLCNTCPPPPPTMSLVSGRSWPRISSHLPVFPVLRFPRQLLAAAIHFHPRKDCLLQFFTQKVHNLSLRLEASRPVPSYITRKGKTCRAHLQVSDINPFWAAP